MIDPESCRWQIRDDIPVAEMSCGDLLLKVTIYFCLIELITVQSINRSVDIVQQWLTP